MYKPATAEGPAENVPTPVLPEKAKEFSKAGLLASAEHWYMVLGFAYETGDVDPLTSVTDPSCKTCAAAKESIVSWYGTGGWLVGGQITVHDKTSKFVESPDGTYQAILMIQQNKITSYTEDGTVDADLPARKARADIVVASYDNERWTVLKAEHLTKD